MSANLDGCMDMLQTAEGFASDFVGDKASELQLMIQNNLGCFFLRYHHSYSSYRNPNSYVKTT